MLTSRYSRYVLEGGTRLLIVDIDTLANALLGS